MVDYVLQAHQTSRLRACRLMKLSRSAYAYQKTLSDDGSIKKALKELAEKHCRYGFKMMFSKLRQQGCLWNHKRVYRVYCEVGLNIRCKPKKRLPNRKKIELEQPKKINICWSLDYMSDAFMNGKRFRTANVIDDCNRQALGIKASVSLPAKRVTEFLDDIASQRGYPQYLRVDNGPENISKDMQDWASRHGVLIQFIQPGKPAQNAYIERFNRTYREEILSMYLFKNITEVQEITDRWILEYNNERPHQSLGNLTPKAFLEEKLFSTKTLY